MRLNQNLNHHRHSGPHQRLHLRRSGPRRLARTDSVTGVQRRDALTAGGPTACRDTGGGPRSRCGVPRIRPMSVPAGRQRQARRLSWRLSWLRVVVVVAELIVLSVVLTAGAPAEAAQALNQVPHLVPHLIPGQVAGAVLAQAESIDAVLANLRGWLMGILAGLATVFATIGGIRYVMANGDPGEIEKAKTAFRGAGIGYALAVLAPLVVTVLQGIVGG